MSQGEIVMEEQTGSFPLCHPALAMAFPGCGSRSLRVSIWDPLNPSVLLLATLEKCCGYLRGLGQTS